MSDSTIRVMLADDHAILRSGLKAVLASAPDMQVIGEVGSGREAVAMAERLHPDVIVMDLTMDDMDGMQATKVIAGSGKQNAPRILVLTMHGEDEYLVPLLEAGA